ncbi:MAG: TatD family hydrolase [Lachnospiraceae bacterium]|nr:TatD family hydrolase [Lachnospiraceae bacterium]
MKTENDFYIFDTHAHYDDEAFEEDREALLASLPEHGIRRVVNVGASIASTQRTIQLIQEYPFCYGAAGVHPSEVAELTEEKLVWLEEQLAAKKIVAVGEIGLDYYWPEPEHELQKKWFRRQLELAIAHDMPVIIHSRDAAADTLEIMKEYYAKAEAAGKKLTGVIHCFSYGTEMAAEYLKMGFYLGIGGVVTFKNAVKIKEVVQSTPLERIVLETDSPYLTPVPYRGKRNNSLYLEYIVAAIAELKGLTEEEVVRITCENANRLYRLQQTV